MKFTDFEWGKKQRIALAMKQRGGGFSSRLADAWIHGDLTNQRRIEEAFNDLFMQYVDAP